MAAILSAWCGRTRCDQRDGLYWHESCLNYDSFDFCDLYDCELMISGLNFGLSRRRLAWERRLSALWFFWFLWFVWLWINDFRLEFWVVAAGTRLRTEGCLHYDSFDFCDLYDCELMISGLNFGLSRRGLAWEPKAVWTMILLIFVICMIVNLWLQVWIFYWLAV